jgi:hypothetical protein
MLRGDITYYGIIMMYILGSNRNNMSTQLERFDQDRLASLTSEAY